MTTGQENPASWGSVLAGTGLVDDDLLLPLQAFGITTIEDLASLAITDAEAVSRLMPDADIATLEGTLIDESPLLQAAGGPQPNDGYFWFGAEPPPAASVPEQIPADPSLGLQDLVETDAVPPASPDLSDAINLSDDMQPIRDQQTRPTCVAHAGAAALEYALKQRTGEPHDLSEQFLYWACKTHDGFPNVEGTWINVVMTRMQADGSLLEPEWPYNPAPEVGDQAQGPPPGGWESAAANWMALTVNELPPKSSAEFLLSLSAGVPVAFSIPIFATSSEVRVWQNPTGKIPMPLPDTNRIGGHAMCAVGYQPDETAPGGGFFIIRNSWGTRFASASPFGAGYGALPRAYIDRFGMEAWALD